MHLYYFTIIMIALVSAGMLNSRADTGNSQYNEYQVKAAFLFNFIKFTDWPENKTAELNTIIIGILGQDQFGDSFNSIQNNRIGDKILVIKRFGKFSDLCKDPNGNMANPCANLENLKKCHLLFVCKSETPHLKQILEAVSVGSVLTAGEYDEFLDSGGIINFIISDNKVVFEINTAAAKRAKIQINSRVLRLAKRIKTD